MENEFIMRKAFKYFILTSLVFSTTCISYTYAQEISNANEEDCAVTLRKSQKLYEDGLIEQVPINILSCLENGGFTNEDKSSAIRLMIYAYLFDDKKVKAEEYMIKLLKLDPELQINEAVDPQEFIQLYNSFRTSPTYSFNFSIGSNLTFVSLMTQYGVHDVNNQQPLYSTELGFNVGVGVNRNLFKNAAISLDFIYTQFKTQYTAVQLDIFNVSYQEDLAFVTAPLSFKYSLNNRKSPLFPHFRIGGTVGYLFDSESELTREYIDGSKVPVEGPKVSLLDSRKSTCFLGNGRCWNKL